MADKVLVIVESAAKAKTIGKFLGRNYVIKASVGHIRDLPKSSLGVDIDSGFVPRYITIRGKGELLKEIKEEAAKAGKVLLATDPDREGEAIAWHLTQAININPDSMCRIEFNEITKDAVKKAVKNPRAIDMDRVNAQQARRVLDRLVGYNLSPLLWAKVRKGLSGGRVQSVAVRLISDREREIQDFITEEYWTIDVELLTADRKNLTVHLVGKGKEKLDLRNKDQVDKVLKELKKLDYVITEIDNREKRRKALAPFTTSTMQQEAYRKLGFTSSRTMRIAQELYEGLAIGSEGNVGLITYLRTDSTRISAEAQQEALQYIEERYGSSYRPENPNIYKTKKTAQDAHEAIRPTSAYRHPDQIKSFLSRDQHRLYKLIWERFVASQMSPAVYDTQTVDVKAGSYLLRANGSILKFPGHLAVYQDSELAEYEKKKLPPLKNQERLQLVQTLPEQHFTQPPPRFTEATLVKLLEEKNIGRPSTYAPIIETIIKRGYVERKNKQFVPTELGYIVGDILLQHFPEIMDVEFTASMEEELDDVEEHGKVWQDTITEFWSTFSHRLEDAEATIEKVEIKPEEAGKDCPQCGQPLVYRMGRYGKFMACSGFPACKYTESMAQEAGVACPKCGAPILTLRTKRGRLFYGCKNYPQCDFKSWNLPSGQKCPVCGEFMVEKTVKGEKAVVCTNPECKHQLIEV
ncbi:MAG: type I DNA topoisomerase [Methylocystaceae bacterium]